MFPGAADVVRVETDRWKQSDDEMLDKLMERIACFIQARSHLPFEALRRQFHDNDIRIHDGGQYVHVLFGPEPLFISDGELKLDVKRLVYRPQSRVYKGKLIAEF